MPSCMSADFADDSSSHFLFKAWINRQMRLKVLRILAAIHASWVTSVLVRSLFVGRGPVYSGPQR